MNDLNEIGQRLRAARRVLFVTGAGISADSGLPTYRGVGGLYNGEITEDDQRKAEDEMQKVTDAAIKDIDKIAADKEKEIMMV